MQIVQRSEDPFYAQDLENRAAEQGWQEEIIPSLDGPRATLEIDLEPTTNVVCNVVRPSEMDDDYGFGGIYDGGQPRPGQVERSNTTLIPRRLLVSRIWKAIKAV